MKGINIDLFTVICTFHCQIATIILDKQCSGFHLCHTIDNTLHLGA